jgi:hypothetical protein
LKYLFIDDHHIEEIDNLARILHQPRKFGAVLQPQFRWENIGVNIVASPMWDPSEEVYKLIYGATAESLDFSTADLLTNSVSAPSRGDGFYCYATSRNGFNWEKPFLELYDYEGLAYTGKPIGNQNNIIPNGVSCVRDPNDPDPGRRYKAQHHADGTRSHNKKFAVSPDCFKWEWLDVPPIPEGGTSSMTYDEENGLFIIMVKRRGPYGRSVCVSTSTDFENWTDAEMVFHADAQDQVNGRERLEKFFDDSEYSAPSVNRPREYKTDVYQLPVFPYEGIYIGMPVMFHQSGGRPPMYENSDGRKSIELVCSRDLHNWERVADRKPFMEQSPLGDGSAYDTGQLGPSNRPIVRNDELWFYYGGHRHRGITQEAAWSRKYLDASAICLAKLRLDGFCSLQGEGEPGSVLTKPLEVGGSELHINVDSWRGSVQAELLDANDGRPIPGYSMEESVAAMADRIDEPIHWKTKKDVADLAGRTVRVRFSICSAELYAFWFSG